MVFLSSYMGSLNRVRNRKKYALYVLSWRIVYSLNSGNKNNNNTLVSPETVRHSSLYIIFYLYHYFCTQSDLNAPSAMGEAVNASSSE